MKALQIILVVASLGMAAFGLLFTVIGWGLFWDAPTELSALTHALQYCTGMVLVGMSLIVFAIAVGRAPAEHR